MKIVIALGRDSSSKDSVREESLKKHSDWKVSPPTPSQCFVYPERDHHPVDVYNIFLKKLHNTEEKKYDSVYIITNSEVIVNMIGELIESKNIDHKEVEIRVYSSEKKSKEYKTYRFDNKGYIIKWCYGFFSYKQEDFKI